MSDTFHDEDLERQMNDRWADPDYTPDHPAATRPGQPVPGTDQAESKEKRDQVEKLQGLLRNREDRNLDDQIRRLTLLLQEEHTPEELGELGGYYELAPISLRDLDDRLNAEPPPRWLVRGLIEQASYGAFGATRKAGKSVQAGDFAVSVASGTPLMNELPVDVTGPVLLFVGEGGSRTARDRLAAIAKNRGLDHRDLPIQIVDRAPNLTSDEHLQLIDLYCATYKPVLVIIDPYYLCIPGVNMSDLAAAAQPLAAIQRILQRHGAAGIVVHHWNKTGTGTGVDRYSGVGLVEWGRFLISMNAAKTVDPSLPGKRAEIAILDFDIVTQHGERTMKARRRMWRDDPDDLMTELHYEIEVLPEEDELTGGTWLDNEKPAVKRVWAALTSQPDRWWTVQAIGDFVAKDGTTFKGELSGLKPRTIQDAAKALLEGARVHQHQVATRGDLGWMVLNPEDGDVEYDETKVLRDLDTDGNPF